MSKLSPLMNDKLIQTTKFNKNSFISPKNNFTLNNTKNNIQKLTDKIYINKDQVLGKGATGIVYLGIILQQSTIQVAIKAINMKEINNEVVQYLLKCQIQAMKMASKFQLSQNQQQQKNVVHLYDVIYQNNYCYLVMQKLNGRSLKKFIKEIKEQKSNKKQQYSHHYNHLLQSPHNSDVSQNKRLLFESQEQILKLFYEVVKGYYLIKSLGIIHRDLKPQNILLHNHKPKIIDFGYCICPSVQNIPQAYYNVGSPKYMSPQAYTKSQYSQKSDIWGLGVILYEMLIGYSFDVGIEVNESHQKIKQNGLHIPCNSIHNQKIINLMKIMLAYDPKQRGSTDYVLQSLQIILNEYAKPILIKQNLLSPRYTEKVVSNTKIIKNEVQRPISNSKTKFNKIQGNNNGFNVHPLTMKSVRQIKHKNLNEHQYCNNNQIVAYYKPENINKRTNNNRRQLLKINKSDLVSAKSQLPNFFKSFRQLQIDNHEKKETFHENYQNLTLLKNYQEQLEKNRVKSREIKQTNKIQNSRQKIKIKIFKSQRNFIKKSQNYSNTIEFQSAKSREKNIQMVRSQIYNLTSRANSIKTGNSPSIKKKYNASQIFTKMQDKNTQQTSKNKICNQQNKNSFPNQNPYKYFQNIRNETKSKDQQIIKSVRIFGNTHKHGFSSQNVKLNIKCNPQQH